MADLGERQVRLLLAAGIAAAFWFAVYDLWAWMAALALNPYATDLRSYLAAAEAGLTYGWAHVYDDALLRRLAIAMDPRHRPLTGLPLFASPLPLAWLALPLTWIPYPVAYAVWTLATAALLGAAWWWLAAGRWAVRVLLGAGAVAWYPLIHGFQIANVAVAVAAAFGIALVLLRRGHDWPAGLLMCSLALKPNLAPLVPVALLVAGRWRPAAAVALAAVLTLAASALVLGGAGVAAWLAVLHEDSALEFNRHLTLLGALPMPVALAVQAGAVVLGLYVARRSRRVEVVFAGGAVAGLLAAPYLHLQDFTILAVAGWGLSRLGGLVAAWLAVVLITGELVWVIGPLAFLAALAAWLVLMVRVPPEPAA